MKAFVAFKNKADLPHQAVENDLYWGYRGLTIGAPGELGAQNQFKNLSDSWDRDARELSLPPKRILPNLSATQQEAVRKHGYEESLGQGIFSESMFAKLPFKDLISKPEPPVNYNVKLQFNRNGETVVEKKAPPETSIDAISVMVVPNAPQVSRINIVVHPECSGQLLYKKMNILNITLTRWGCSSSGAICSWKVMSPQLSSTGPEAAVIYLSQPINNGTVTHLTYMLCGILGNDLVSLRECPIGHVELARGIYGFDLPREIDETRVFKKSYDSSAGRFMSAIIAKAAREAVEWLKRRSDVVVVDESEVVRDMLADVLAEFEWELDD